MPTTDGQRLSALIYRRGFLLTLGPHERPRPHWSTFNLPSAYLSYDPDVPFAFVQSAGRWLCLLGPAYDVVQGQGDLRTIATALLDARQRSRAALHEALDAVAGRYLLIDGDADGIHVQTDATAARSAFRQTGPGGGAASHVQLLADAVGAGAPTGADLASLEAAGPQRPPGLLTGRAGILVLTPNTELELRSGELRRTWPRRGLELHTPADVAARIAPLLTGHTVALRSERGSVAELTTGVVNRALLAVSRSLRGTRYLTAHLDYEPHRGNATSQLSLQVAGDLARRLRLSHQVVTVPGPLPAGPLRDTLTRNVPHRIMLATLAAQLEQLAPDHTYLRPDALSLGRSQYRHTPRQRERFDVTSMARAASAGKDPHPAVARAFADLAEQTHFLDVVEHGFNPYDVLAWEYRVGRHASAQLLAQDAVFDPVAVGNARCVIEALLSVSREDHLASRALKLLVEQCWPAALEYPLNQVMKPGQQPAKVRSRAVREKPELTALPEVEAKTGLPIQRHTSIGAFTLPFAPGSSRHRVTLHLNDARGEALAPLFGPLDLDVLLDERPGETLLVMLHGSTDQSRYPYPRFERRKAMVGYTGGSVLWLADPTLRLSPSLECGWYVGPAHIDVAVAGAQVVEQVATAVGAAEVVLTGAGPGGFAALAISRHVEGSAALVFDPHTDVLAGEPALRTHLLSAAFPGLDSSTIAQVFTDRVDLTGVYARPTPNRVRLLRHPAAPSDAHLERFAAACGLDPAGGSSADGSRALVIEDYEQDKRGPTPAEVLRHLSAWTRPLSPS